jgi:hypothetical protein
LFLHGLLLLLVLLGQVLLLLFFLAANELQIPLLSRRIQRRFVLWLVCLLLLASVTYMAVQLARLPRTSTPGRRIRWEWRMCLYIISRRQRWLEAGRLLISLNIRTPSLLMRETGLHI